MILIHEERPDLPAMDKIRQLTFYKMIKGAFPHYYME